MVNSAGVIWKCIKKKYIQYNYKMNHTAQQHNSEDYKAYLVSRSIF